MDASATHLHLLLNHVPTVGFILAVGLFMLGLAARSDHLKVASLVITVAIALISIPVFVTGAAAQEQICVPVNADGPCPDASVPRGLIEMHEGAALIALLLMEIVGGIAWLGLWYYRRAARFSTGLSVAFVVLAFVTVALVAQAANLGGEIRHPEIRVTAVSGEPAIGRIVGNFISGAPWTWITCETLHFIGLTLLIGVVGLIDMRVLGFLPEIPYTTLDRLLPWAILGFGLNVVTGMLFFVATPYFYVGNLAFNWKVAFIVAAGLNTLWFTVDRSWLDHGAATPVAGRVLAVTALLLWIGVMYWGSMLPVFGQAF